MCTRITEERRQRRLKEERRKRRLKVVKTEERRKRRLKVVKTEKDSFEKKFSEIEESIRKKYGDTEILDAYLGF